MVRQKILNTLLIASFGAMAATAAAQTSAPENNTPRNAPVGTTAAPSVSGSGGQMAPGSNGQMAPGYTTRTPSSAMDSSLPSNMTGYKSARTTCDKQPMSSRSQCVTDLNTRYSSVNPKCQKLSGSLLDDCLKGADN
jgi:hypothetical protein